MIFYIKYTHHVVGREGFYIIEIWRDGKVIIQLNRNLGGDKKFYLIN